MATQSSYAQSETLTRFTLSRYIMGVDARLVVYAKDQTSAESACIAAFERMSELDSIMSDYQKESELNRLCAEDVGRFRKVSRDLYKVIDFSLKISEQTEGAFDISAGPLVRLWRAARKSGKLPLYTEISRIQNLVGYQKISLEPGSSSVKLTQAGMQLDLGGIAKGYACDEAQKVLKVHGIFSALVEMGGDVVVSDAPPGKAGWTVLVPNAEKLGIAPQLEIKNCAISSSGDTEQFATIGGRHFSHVVDPRSGLALFNRVQATVICPSGLESDPLSTSLTLLSETKRRLLLKSYPSAKAFVRTIPGSD